MSIYINGCRKVNDIYINANGKKKVNSCWVNKNGNPTKVFSSNNNISNIVNGVKIVSWADGTYEEIADMLDGHYSGKINISDYWNVGDERIVETSYMTNCNWDTWGAREMSFIILGFDHDDIGNGKKAAVSVSMRIPVISVCGMGNEPTFGYSNSKRRNWCNTNFLSSLPNNLQKLIKPVSKLTYVYYKSTGVLNYMNISDNYCWLLSAGEVANKNSISLDTPILLDGNTYSYFDSGKNIDKRSFALRTSSSANHKTFKCVTGDYDITLCDITYDAVEGILVGFCI